MEVHVHADAAQLAEMSSARINDLISEASDGFTLGLSGGSTPLATYRTLRREDVSWEKVDAWLSDERWVPHEHERCNGRMATEILFDHVAGRLHRPRWGESLDPPDAAAHYEAELRSLHGDRRPDLVMLGVGTDGHTASLYPGTAALDERERWYVANYVAALGEDRLTATYPLLWRAKLLMVLAVGSEKAAAVRDSLEGKTPAGRLDEGEAAVEWHLDPGSASLLG